MTPVYFSKHLELSYEIDQQFKIITTIISTID